MLACNSFLKYLIDGRLNESYGGVLFFLGRLTQVAKVNEKIRNIVFERFP